MKIFILFLISIPAMAQTPTPIPIPVKKPVQCTLNLPSATFQSWKAANCN